MRIRDVFPRLFDAPLIRRRLPLALSGLAALSLPSCERPASESWRQWGQNAQHTGSIDVIGQSPERILATIEVDPFAIQIGGGGPLHVHYPVPLLKGDDAYLMVKTGAYTGLQRWDTQEWNWKALRWESGQLQERSQSGHRRVDPDLQSV